MRRLTGIAAAALLATSLAGGLALPTAASAQVTVRFGQPGFWTPERSNAIRSQIWRLDNSVDRATQHGAIDRREVWGLRRDVRSLRNQFDYFNRNGLNLQEVRILQGRINSIRSRLRMERLDWDREDYWTSNRWRDSDHDGLTDRLDPRPYHRY